jgi:cell division septation protein DedD
MAKIKTRTSDSRQTKPKDINKRSFEKVYWPYIPIVLAISLLLSIGVSSGNLQAYVKHPGGRVLSYATSMSIGGLLADTNTQRVANGVNSLSLNGKLDAAAQASADDMAARNYWSHNTPEGSPPWIWVSNQGYAYQKVGQNLATGFNDEQSTINGWMNSPPHRENLLDPAYSDVGFGFANNPNYTAAGGGPMTIVVAFYGEPQVLGTSSGVPASPKPAAPVSNTSSSPPPAASTPAATSPTPTPAPKPATAAQPDTSQKPSAAVTPAVKTSRLQTAVKGRQVPPAVTTLSIIAALAIFGFWASRHLSRLQKFMLEGERYALRHPLTDIGLLIIASLLFILSQTAGIIQ